MSLIKEECIEEECKEGDDFNHFIDNFQVQKRFKRSLEGHELVSRLISGVMSGIESAISSEENKKTSSNEFKTAGVLGGMGPEATLDLHRKILSKSDAEKDQENIPVMIFNNPQIPDRSDHILNDGECPLDEMVETARSLERAGADFIVIPCNTAHHFFDDIDSSVGIETINLIEEATDFVVSEYPEAENIGLLITTGSMETEVYSSFIEESGREPMVPDDNFQDNVMDSIYEIKKGEKTESKKKLEKATENLIRKGSDAVIMGCTEIPLVLSNNDFPVPLIDPVEILAEKVVEVSKNESSYSA